MQITKFIVSLAVMAGAVQAIARPEVVRLGDLEGRDEAVPNTRKRSGGNLLRICRLITSKLRIPLPRLGTLSQRTRNCLHR